MNTHNCQEYHYSLQGQVPEAYLIRNFHSLFQPPHQTQLYIMSKRSRENDDGLTQVTKKAKRDDSMNPNMTNKARYSSKGFYCPESHIALEMGKQLNNGIPPDTIATFTSDFDMQNEWSENNLPEILFYIKKPEIRKLQSTMDANGQVIIPKIVPDQISILTPEWMIGAWLRLDPSITLKQIRARMSDDLNYIGGPLKVPSHPALNNRMYRKCASIFGHWDGGRAKNQQQIRDQLTHDQILFNTILKPICIGNELRLCKKRAVNKEPGTSSITLVDVEVNEDNYLETTFPWRHFLLDDNSDCPTEMTPALTEGSSPQSEAGPATPPISGYDFVSSSVAAPPDLGFAWLEAEPKLTSTSPPPPPPVTTTSPPPPPPASTTLPSPLPPLTAALSPSLLSFEEFLTSEEVREMEPAGEGEDYVGAAPPSPLPSPSFLAVAASAPAEPEPESEPERVADYSAFDFSTPWNAQGAPWFAAAAADAAAATADPGLPSFEQLGEFFGEI